MTIEATVMEGALRVLARARLVLDEELRIERKALDEAAKEKRALVAHYWQGRFIAEQRVRAAEQIVAALVEMNK
jgi:hypothetical protein